VPSGARPTARPGGGPGRGRPRARTQARRPTAAQAPPPTSPPADAPATAARQRSSLTTRAIALAVVLLILMISYASSLRIFFTQRREIATTRAEIGARQQAIEELQAELGRWDDVEYVKTQARERLGWVVPGEIGYRVVGPDGKPIGGGAEITSVPQPTENPTDAWWSRLWGSLEAADQPAPARKDPGRRPPITEHTKPNDSTPTPTPSASPR
jgi:cell division protein FtsB